MRHILFLACCILFLAHCDKRIEEPSGDLFGKAYYPLAIGHTWVYEMDSIVVKPALNNTVEFDSVHTQMQEILVDTFTDLSGQLWYRGERSFRANETEAWRFSQTFLLATTERGALRKEGNLLFVSLGFPATRGHQWDGNSAFDEFTEISVGGETVQMFFGWDYRILEAEVPSMEPEPSFPDVIRVQAADDEGLISKRLVIEAYAKNVGLIYRELEILDTQCQRCCNNDTGLCLDVSWREKVEKGFYLRQRLIDFQ